MRIVFFGTPIFAARILHHLIIHQVDIVAIVTRTDKPRGRSSTPQPTAVKEIAQEIAPEIPLYQPKKASEPEFIATLAKHKPDLCIVVAYGEIMKQNLLDLPKHGCINVHASLLPEYRGAAPIQRAIMDGKKETGVTIMEMVRALDAGNMIAWAKTRITETMDCGMLHDKLCDLSCPLLLDVIEQYARGKATSTPQEESEVTYAHKIDQQECRIDWRKSAKDVHNLVRGVSPRPGAWCELTINGKTKRLKIFRTTVDYTHSGAPGAILKAEGDTCIVACSDGALHLHDVQLEGKKKMRIDEFIRGKFLSHHLQ